MSETNKPYWMKKLKPYMTDRIKKIVQITQASLRAGFQKTIRNINYKLHPNLHGKPLDLAYNRTVKLIVRGRTNFFNNPEVQIDWDSIR